MAEAVDAFTDRAGPAAIEELVCLREALSRRLRGRVPAGEAEETWSRLQMTIDRAIACAARRAFSQLEQAACVDALTGVDEPADVRGRRQPGSWGGSPATAAASAW